MEAPRVLIADDQVHILEALELLLKNQGFVPETVNSPKAVIQAVQARGFDVLLLDLNYTRDTTSGGEGLELLGRIREIDDSLPVVLMTAWANVELAVEAMQGGSGDFVQKPWDNDKLVETLRKQIQEGRTLRAKKQQMQDAGRIQSRLLPAHMPTLRGCDLKAFWQPAEEVGGDYFDAIGLDPNRAAICIADVAGKGLPAALLMSNLQANVRNLALTTSSPADVCQQLNRVAFESTVVGKFTTLFYAVLDSDSGILRYCNAGHIPPILIRNDGTVDRLTQGGIVLGIFPDADYLEGEVVFQRGDRLVLVTDGITEAVNLDAVEFGEERLIRFLLGHGELAAGDLQNQLLQALASFAGNNRLRDDATLMIVAMAKDPALAFAAP